MSTLNEDRPEAGSAIPPPGDGLHGLQDDAMALLDSAKERGAEHLENYREDAAEQIDSLARSATSAAEKLQENDTLGLSHYITDLAESLGTFAGSLRGKSADELLQDVGRLARENPALFVTGSVAIGFGLSRFMRASSPELTAASTTDAGNTAAKAPDPEFDAGIAAQEDVALRPKHEGDATTSATWSRTPPPESPSGDAGIQPSGAELGSFSSDPGSTDDGLSSPDGKKNEMTSRGEL